MYSVFTAAIWNKTTIKRTLKKRPKTTATIARNKKKEQIGTIWKMSENVAPLLQLNTKQMTHIFCVSVFFCRFALTKQLLTFYRITESTFNFLNLINKDKTLEQHLCLHWKFHNSIMAIIGYSCIISLLGSVTVNRIQNCLMC